MTWTFTDATGLAALFDPDDQATVTLASGRVLSLADALGDASKITVEADPAKQPTIGAADPDYGGRDVLVYEDANRDLASGPWDTPLVGPVTVYFVGQTAINGALVQFWDFIHGGGGSVESVNNSPDSNPNSVMLNGAGGPVLTTSTLQEPIDAPAIITAVFAGGSSAAYVNQQATSYCTGSLSPTTVYGMILGQWPFGGYGLFGKLACVMVCAGAHDATEIAKNTAGLNALFFDPPSPPDPPAGEGVSRGVHVQRVGALTGDEPVSAPLGGDVTVYPGTIALLREGFLVSAYEPAASDTCIGLIGDVAGGSAAQTGQAITGNGIEGPAGVWIDCLTGTFLLASGTGADTLTEADVGSQVYVIDEISVGKTSGSGTRPVAGQLMPIDLSMPAGMVPVRMVLPT